MDSLDESTADSQGEIGPIAYAFEPIRIHSDNDQASSAESDSSICDTDSDVEDHGHRLGNSDWCKCKQCGPMPTVVESVCCQEIPALEPKLVNAEIEVAQDSTCITENQEIPASETELVHADYTCITENTSFFWICLDLEALEVALLSMADVRADNLARPINSR